MPLIGPPLDHPVDMTQLLSVGLQSKPDDVAVVSLATRWSWRDLDAISTRLAQNLLGLGLNQGDRIASLMPNRTVQLLYYIACLKAGLVSTPLNYRYMAPEIDHALEVSEAVALIAHTERDTDLAKCALVPNLRFGVISFEADDGHRPSLETLIETEPASAVLPTVLPDDPICIFFTSGSTGKPKGVTHTLDSMGWALNTAINGFEITASDTILAACSASHIGGYILCLSAFAAGARVSVARTFDGDEILPLFRKEHPTILAMLPAPLIALVRDHGAAHDDFSSLRYCLSGGDKVSAKLDAEFKALVGQDIREDYGMTEVGLITLSPPTGLNKLGSVGTLNPGIEASLRDDAGNEVPVDTEGRLWVRSPGNTVGYWNNGEATEETIVNGWLDTGDVMAADEDGYLWFRGRRKQIIVHDGSNITPQEIEEVLLDHEAVALAGVVGVHSLVHGENVRAYVIYVIVREGVTRPSAQELIQFARERVGYKAPEDVKFLETMPMTATGKVDRVSLKQWAQAEHAGIPTV